MILVLVLISLQVYGQCGLGQVFFAPNRSCVNPEDIENQCSPACDIGGTFSINLGICACNKYDRACDDHCENDRLEGSVQKLPEGILSVTFTDSSGHNVTVNDSQGVGIDNDDDDHAHAFELLVFSEYGVFGALVETVVGAAAILEPSSRNSSIGRRKRRAVKLKDVLLIPSPTICLEYGKALIFKVQVNPLNRFLSHYPRYSENHLLNQFDFKKFTLLHHLIQETSETVDILVHVFMQNGTFVFYDYGNPFQETIVKVMAQGYECPNIGTVSFTNYGLLLCVNIFHTNYNQHSLCIVISE